MAPRAPLVIIPARIASTRLPGKALAEIGGEPMILRVWRRAVDAGLGPVAIATNSPEIADVAAASGATVVVTASTHPCGTDRVAEAVARLDPERRHGAIVNLQGDNPFLPDGALAAAVALLDEPGVDVGTLAAPASAPEADDPNAVKLVGAPLGERRFRALYFTRARAPYGEGPLLKHIGVYAFRRNSLERFAVLPPSALERRERLEQLRALEAGMRIDAALLDEGGPSVDTVSDLAAARASAQGQEKQ